MPNEKAAQSLNSHIISLGNDGLLQEKGEHTTSKQDLERIFQEDFPRITEKWHKKRLLLYAHGGLTAEKNAVIFLNAHRDKLIEREIYPISFIWHTWFFDILKNIFDEWKKPQKNSSSENLDDKVESLLRKPGGELWSEMKENALYATEKQEGGARLAIAEIFKLIDRYPDLEIHVVGYSAGSIFQAPIVKLLTEKKENAIESCTLWAPACTLEIFEENYQPAIESESIKRFTLYTLTDEAEQDDNCLHIYNKSLLYLVSNALDNPNGDDLETSSPLLGMAKFIEDNLLIQELIKAKKIDWIALGKNSEMEKSKLSHGAFDTNPAILEATLARILGSDSFQLN